jgi:hypothetical protein
MFDLGDPEKLWIAANWCVWGAAVVSGLVIVRETVLALRKRLDPSPKPRLDDHSFLVPQLGMTMADGGERTDGPRPSGPAAEK